jgi:hypothetical protein
MTAFTPPEVPPCPACGSDGRPSTSRHIGRYECAGGGCWTFYDGTTSEWERYAPTREYRTKRRTDA